ncbi:hypothetical protein [Kitasatospora purpeofusca]|uniref:hypothetical protein n=1 Tax=Kitasatospora purpeofusca TaxID=67352 RepID=UPI00365E533E
MRMHHAGHRQDLDHFFHAYGGPVPAWPVRRAAMLARCAELEQFCHRWESNDSGARQWQERAAMTAGWQE